MGKTETEKKNTPTTNSQKLQFLQEYLQISGVELKKTKREICKKYLKKSCRKPEKTKIENSRFGLNIWKFAEF